jgi:hypothetical protein
MRRSRHDPEPFLDERGAVLANSISEKIRVDINGVQQGMIIRGEDVTNPVHVTGPQPLAAGGWVHRSTSPWSAKRSTRRRGTGTHSATAGCAAPQMHRPSRRAGDSWTRRPGMVPQKQPQRSAGTIVTGSSLCCASDVATLPSRS